MKTEHRIATYNIHRAVGRDKQIDNLRILSVIKEINADIIGLQEVSFDHNDAQNILNLFKSESDYQIYEGITLKDDFGDYGNIVLSRIPIENFAVLDLSIDQREARSAIVFEGVMGNRLIQVVSTHLGLRHYERRKQIRKLLPIIRKSKAKVKILIGDMNEWLLWGLPLGWLNKEYGPTPAKRTFPAHRPLLALDRCWVSPVTCVKRVMAHSTPLSRIASDHLPLVVDVKL